MIRQQMMSPAIALFHWRENGMSIDKVMSHTGYKCLSDLHDEYIYDLIAEERAQDDFRMTAEDHQREEDVELVWSEFASYMKEFVPPDEYADEIERLLPLVQMTRQIREAARSQGFRNSVRRRLN
jgi:hypothetical protein